MTNSSEPIHIISLGAGVQSSTMALMAQYGELTPMPESAIFADTGDEPKEVYYWLRILTTKIPSIRVIQLKGERLSDGIINKWGHSEIPAFFINDSGELSIGKRQCTNHWKIQPIRREARKIMESYGSKKVILWHGISTDEISRAKDSNANWIEHRFPLIERRMSRMDCLEWLKRNHIDYVPKSACFFCPYRNDKQWRTSKTRPEEWGLISEIDLLLNKRNEFLHRSCRPINEVDFSTEEERGQLNMFNNECEGMCGV